MLKSTDLSPALRKKLGIRPRKLPRSMPAPRDPAWEAKMCEGPGVFVPIRTVPKGNELNKNYWTMQKLIREHRQIVAMELRKTFAPFKHGFHPGLSVQLTRYGPKKLDAFDNVRSALKSVVDEIAFFYGVDDADPRWDWLAPIQVKTKNGQHGVRIEITPKV